MTRRCPVVVIASREQQLESVASAVASEVARECGAPHLPVRIGSARRDVPTPREDALWFLGWDAGRENSLTIVESSLAALADATPVPSHVALFAIHPQGGPSSASSGVPSWDPGRVRVIAPVESFASTSEGVERSEQLHRARQWAARVYADWHSNSRTNDPGSPGLGAPPEGPKSVPWCGMMD